MPKLLYTLMSQIIMHQCMMYMTGATMMTITKTMDTTVIMHTTAIGDTTMDTMDMDTMETNIDLRHKRATEGSANLSRHEMADWVTGVLDGLFTEERYNKQFRPGQSHF